MFSSGTGHFSSQETFFSLVPTLDRYGYPGLDGGVDKLRTDEFGRLGDAVYLDHAG